MTYISKVLTKGVIFQKSNMLNNSREFFKAIQTKDDQAIEKFVAEYISYDSIDSLRIISISCRKSVIKKSGFELLFHYSIDDETRQDDCLSVYFEDEYKTTICFAISEYYHKLFFGSDL